MATLKLDMRDIAYGAEELRAPAGAVFAIEFRNRGVIEHDFTIDAFTGDASAFALTHEDYAIRVLLDRGDSATLLLRVPQAGTIEFYCTIPGHREVGMEGTLVIE
ncbi:MAG: cupredoxin domain-containing protein [Chloroflexota bacterium]|nr:cupredoxin domain-containing protein [Chloroflexota bacterium]